MEIGKDKYHSLIKIVKEEGMSTDLSGIIETMLFVAKKNGSPFYLPKAVGLMYQVGEEYKVFKYLEQAGCNEEESMYIQDILKKTKKEMGEKTKEYTSGLAEKIIENSK